LKNIKAQGISVEHPSLGRMNQTQFLRRTEMRHKLMSLTLVMVLFCLAVPALAQDGNGRWIRRDKNGIRVGDGRINILDGPGIINYEKKNRWMPGAGGAATVIGIGAGAGAATGAVTNGKKGAVWGAVIGAGAATGVWLYKNRTERKKIF
jgi:hypothetical protein